MAGLLIILDNGNYIQGTIDVESKLDISKIVMKFSLDVDDNIKISFWDSNNKMLHEEVVSNVEKEYSKFIKNINSIDNLSGLTNLFFSNLKVEGVKFTPLAVKSEGLNRRGFSFIPSQSYSPEPLFSSQDTEPLSQEEGQNEGQSSTQGTIIQHRL